MHFFRFRFGVVGVEITPFFSRTETIVSSPSSIPEIGITLLVLDVNTDKY